MQLSDFGIQKISDDLYLLDKLIDFDGFSLSAKIKFRLVEKIENLPEMLDCHVGYFISNINKNDVIKDFTNACSFKDCFLYNGLSAMVSLARLKRKNSIIFFDDDQKRILKYYDDKLSYKSLGDGMTYSPNFGSYRLHFTSNDVIKDFITSKTKDSKVIFIEEIVTFSIDSYSKIDELNSAISYIVSAFDSCESTIDDHIKIHANPKLYFMENVVRPSTIDALLLKFDSFSTEDKSKFLDLNVKSDENASTYKLILRNQIESHLEETQACFKIRLNKKEVSLTDTGILRLNAIKEVSKTNKIFFENEIDWIPMSFFNEKAPRWKNDPFRERSLRFDNINISNTFL